MNSEKKIVESFLIKNYSHSFISKAVINKDLVYFMFTFLVNLHKSFKQNKFC